MSQTNVEVARAFAEAMKRALEAYWRKPRSLVGAMNEGDLDPAGRELLRYLDPGVEWKTAFSLAGETAHGHLGFLSVCDQWLDATEDYRITPREVEDLGSCRVLVVSDLAFKGKGTGIEVTGVSFAVLTVRDGSIVRIDEYSERGEALEAVGPKE